MKIFLFLIALSISLIGFAQDDKTITLVTSGQGKTIDEAKEKALRNAIEQAYGTFISTKTEILNDYLVKDEIISVANGNIEHFDILSITQAQNKDFISTLKTTVSLSKLTSFAQSKGCTIELHSGAFIQNIKKEEFYSATENIALKEFLNFRIKNEIFYDFNLVTHEPQVKTNGYSLNLEIGIKANDNLLIFFSDLYKILENISLTESTASFRQNSGLPVFIVENSDGKKYYLRNKETYKQIEDIERLLYLKAADFLVTSEPQFTFPTADELIKTNVVANNFILFDIQESPNAGVYWNWMPYEYQKFKNTPPFPEDNIHIRINTEFLKIIPKQSELNMYSEHMNSVVNNGRTDFSIVLNKTILFSKLQFERLESFKVIPQLNNYN